MDYFNKSNEYVNSIEDSYTHRYPNTNRREKNLVKEEYFSSTDLRIFFDDEEQTKIGYISFTLNEQLKPIYGYNSRTWDDVAVGNRVITGVFQVPIYNSEEEQVNNFSARLKGSSESKYNLSGGYDEIFNDNYNAENNSYNESENKKLNNIDYVGNTNIYSELSNNKYSNEEAKEYIKKLQTLGYTSVSNSPKDIEITVKNFQKQAGLEVTGIFTSSTRGVIDNLVENTKNTRISIVGMDGYLSPSADGQRHPINSDNCTIVSEYEDTYLIKNMNNNKYYYVKKQILDNYLDALSQQSGEQ